MIFYGLEHLSKAGIKEIAVILGPIREGVKETIGDGSNLGLEITYIDQPDPKGLAATKEGDLGAPRRRRAHLLASSAVRNRIRK